MIFIPSCDNKEDAIRSLSEIYGVSTEKIDRVLQAPEVLEIAESYAEIGKPSFHFVICHMLKADPRTDITHAYYYHSTSYDGSPTWFDEGLLGSSQGVGRFLEKITEWVVHEKRLDAKLAVKAIVKLRSEYEGYTADTCGPYAWNTLAAASSSPGGISYRVPEAIRDLWSSSFCGNGGLVDLRGIIEDRLKPVVVKFKGTISDMNDYCATLWGFLLSDDGEHHFTHTFEGNGRPIPKEDIAALIDVT